MKKELQPKGHKATLSTLSISQKAFLGIFFSRRANICSGVETRKQQQRSIQCNCHSQYFSKNRTSQSKQKSTRMCQVSTSRAKTTKNYRNKRLRDLQLALQGNASNCPCVKKQIKLSVQTANITIYVTATKKKLFSPIGCETLNQTIVSTHAKCLISVRSPNIFFNCVDEKNIS